MEQVSNKSGVVEYENNNAQFIIFLKYNLEYSEVDNLQDK